MAGRSSAAKRRQPEAPAAHEVFDAGRFGRWLRMMLVSFYTDEEAVVADLLCRRQAMLKDTQLAKLLRLPERQVKQLLEARLVPDGLVDRKSDGAGERVSSFYRISPLAVPVAAKRLRNLESSWTMKTQEEFLCAVCGARVDALQAMSLSFKCCGKALSSTAQEEEQRAQRLKRFRSQCQELLRLTRDLEKLPGPNFRVAKVSRPKAKAKALPAVAVPAAPAVPAAVPRAAPVLAPKAKEPPAAALEEHMEDVQVLVQGVPHLLSRREPSENIRRNHSLNLK